MSAKLCVVVSGTQPKLAIREVERATGKGVVPLSERLGLLEVALNEVRVTVSRLYECLLVQEVLIVKAWVNACSTELEFYRRLAASCAWPEVEGKRFAVAVRKLGGYPPLDSPLLAAQVAAGVLSSCRCRVDLENPAVEIGLVASREAAVLGLRLLKLRGDRFRIRSKRFKAFKHPASITPEEARLLVNTAACQRLLLDPFCGSGTLVIEACTQSLEAVGADVDRRVAQGALLNLKLFSCDAASHIVVADARRMPFRDSSFDCIATNPPYGRILQLRVLRDLYAKFLHEGFRVVKASGTVALVRPRGEEVEGFLGGEEYDLCVHGSLVRVFNLIKVQFGEWCGEPGWR